MEEKILTKSQIRARRFAARFSNKFMVIRGFSALTLFAISYIFFTPMVRSSHDIGRLFLIVYGLLILFLTLLLVVDYFIKTVNLQNTEVKSYSAFLTINTFLGLIIPLFYSNAIISTIVQSIKFLQVQGAYACEIKCNLVNFYYYNNIFGRLNDLIYVLVVATLLIFLVGGFIERMMRKN